MKNFIKQQRKYEEELTYQAWKHVVSGITGVIFLGMIYSLYKLLEWFFF